MIEKKEGGIKYSVLKYSIILVCIAILILTIFSVAKNTNPKEEKILRCNDGTFYDTCSLNKPYYCDDGMLVEKSSVCGCPKAWTIKDEKCDYNGLQKTPKVVSLEYVINGEKDSIKFTTYEGADNYFGNFSKPYRFFTDEKATRRDYKLVQINEPIQRELLLPLVVEIQNRAESKEDQMRIAVSLVQNIPYASSNETYKFLGQEINYSRYPYETLYDGYGICEEKSALLIFLLREIGYGTSSFYYQSENHEAVGIKCPAEKSYADSGYCFVETTGHSIITNYNGNYAFGKLSYPETLITSNGLSLGYELPEYADGKKIIHLMDVLDKKGRLNYFQNKTLEKLKKKYNFNGI